MFSVKIDPINREQQGVHFLDILALAWDPTGHITPVDFYDNYRSLILGTLGRTGDEIKWKNTTLTEDEELTPSHEDLILLNVLTLVHHQLPAFVKEQYGHKLGQSTRLMDFKTEILTNAEQYIAEIEKEQQPLATSTRVQPAALMLEEEIEDDNEDHSQVSRQKTEK